MKTMLCILCISMFLSNIHLLKEKILCAHIRIIEEIHTVICDSYLINKFTNFKLYTNT